MALGCRRSLLLASALGALMTVPGRGVADAQSLPLRAPLPADLSGRREWLLQLNRDQRLQLESLMRCLRTADSFDRLERCRQAPRWRPELDGRQGPWADCPLW